ncbi:MAG: D-alanyl-D-alanine carboxypeptidase [Clostridia bacterium]|nr:D-alanyl-D-alanine carboxypeptidase [Clostridia bacterium]
MKRSVLSVFLIVSVLLPFAAIRANAGTVYVSASSAALIDADDKTVLYGKNEKVKMQPASLTKIMTAIVVIETFDISKEIAVPVQAVGIEGSSAYLSEGEIFTCEELLYALLLQSANDAAVTLAVAVCGSVEAFVSKMNEKAEELRLSGTHFSNPHGLPDKEHYSTSLDMAALLSYCMDNGTFAKISGTETYIIKAAKGRKARSFTNHNRLLSERIGVTGGKTGYTRSGGRCLCTYAERNGVRLCAVTLNAPDDWSDHRTLYKYGFGSYSPVTLDSAGVYGLHVVGGVIDSVTSTVYEDRTVYLRDGANITKAVYMRRFEYAPVYEGELTGYAVFFADGKEICRVPLYADITAAKKQTGFF